MTGDKPAAQRFSSPAVLHAVKVAAFFILLYCLFFSPVLFSQRLLAPGDALSLYLPSFLSPFSLWEPNLQGGTPVTADLQTASLYPVARFFALLGSWNAFVISGYVLLSCFTYAFVYYLTRSWVGALVSGIAAGMSGFMMAHLSHTIVTHGMAWIPLILLAIDKLRTDDSIKWFATGAAAVALSLLAGHPQIPAYGLLVAAGYALMLLLVQPARRTRFALLAIVMVLAGIGLAAVQLLPLFELISQSIRQKPTFRFFAYYSLPPAHLVGLLFPALFGTYEQSFYPYSYFGPANPIEYSGYTGVITILLGIIGIQRHRERHLVWFWTAVIILAGWLALGKATPLGHWIFLIPGLNNLRVSARHLSELTLAVCFLAGFGASALHKGQATRKTIFIAAAAGIAMFLIAGIVIRAHSGDIADMAAKHGITHLSLAPWANPAIEVPIALFITATGVLFLYAQKQTSLRTWLLIATVVADLASFGFFCYWRLSPGKEVVQMPETLRQFQEQLKGTHQRILPVLGVFARPEEGAPNLTRLWNIPNASGYGSLILKRTSRLLSMPTEGTVSGDWAASTNTSLDLMAVRYVFWRSDSAMRSDPNLPEISLPWENMPANSDRWRLVRNFGRFEVFENRNALPRAWLVPKVLRSGRGKILHAILQSQLPDGPKFRPEKMALVEEDFTLSETPDPEASVRILRLTRTTVEMQVQTAHPAFLVLSDVYYPGWMATVNDAPTHLYRTDYALRGVQVPSGQSQIRMEYKPASFRTGLAITIASLLALGCLTAWSAIRIRHTRS